MDRQNNLTAYTPSLHIM